LGDTGVTSKFTAKQRKIHGDIQTAKKGSCLIIPEEGICFNALGLLVKPALANKLFHVKRSDLL